MKLSLGVVNDQLDRVMSKVKVLINIGFAEGDQRGDLLGERISQELYAIPISMFDIKDDGGAKGDRTVEISEERFSRYVSTAQGRILTYVELALPVPHQCEAMKSLASQALWQFPKDVHKLVGTE